MPTVAQLISPQVATNISSHFSGNASEWDAYLGIPLILLLVLATVRFWKMPAIRTAALLALIIAVLSLGPHINVQKHVLLAMPLPWWIPAHIPVLDDILPNRLMVYVYLAAAIIVAFSLRLLWVLRRSPLLNVAVAVVVLLPLAPTLPAPATHVTTPAVFASTVPAPIAPGDTVLFEPFPSSDYLARDGLAGRAPSFAFRLIGGYIIGPYAPGVEALQELIHSIAATYDISYSVPVVHVSDRTDLRDPHARFSISASMTSWSGATPARGPPCSSTGCSARSRPHPVDSSSGRWACITAESATPIRDKRTALGIHAYSFPVSPAPARGGAPVVSLVIPTRNEANNVQPLVDRVTAALGATPSRFASSMTATTTPATCSSSSPTRTPTSAAWFGREPTAPAASARRSSRASTWLEGCTSASWTPTFSIRRS